MQTVKGVGCRKQVWAWRPSPRTSQQQKKQSQQKKDPVRRKKEEHIRWWLTSLQICWPRGQPRSNAREAVRSNAWESLSLASRSNGQHSNLMEKPENTVDRLLRRSRFFPVTTPVTGVTKNFTKQVKSYMVLLVFSRSTRICNYFLTKQHRNAKTKRLSFKHQNTNS